MTLTEALLYQFEGCRLKAYRDTAGFWTIGVGHLVTRDKSAPEPPEITQDEAVALLDADLARTEGAISTLIQVPLTGPQGAALTSLCFNIGSANFAKSALRRFVLAGDHEAAAGQFQRWCYAGGRRNPGLLRRRLEEARVYLS